MVILSTPQKPVLLNRIYLQMFSNTNHLPAKSLIIHFPYKFLSEIIIEASLLSSLTAPKIIIAESECDIGF
jgi:hypothetical protein